MPGSAENSPLSLQSRHAGRSVFIYAQCCFIKMGVMGKMIFNLRRSALLVLLTQLLASASALANSGNGLQEVVAVGIHDSGHATVTLSGADNTEQCATPGHANLVLIHKDHPHFKLFYATAMTALVTGKKASGWVNGCVDVWGTGTLKIPRATTFGLEK